MRVHPPADTTPSPPTITAAETSYLKHLTVTHRARARAARQWRPAFLSALTVSCSFAFAARAAGIAYNTFRAHQRNDSEFAKQVDEAEQEAVGLLHATCWKDAIEGNMEPVYWNGTVVGHIKKFDTRIRIEMLRAHMPDKFARRCTEMNVSNGPSPTLTIGPEEHKTLCDARRASLERLRRVKEAGTPDRLLD